MPQVRGDQIPTRQAGRPMGEVVAVDLTRHGEVVAHAAALPLCTDWLPDGRLAIVSSRTAGCCASSPVRAATRVTYAANVRDFRLFVR
jgi:hypothetical protein